MPWTLASFGGVSQVVENLIREMSAQGEYVPLLMVNSWTDRTIRKETVNDQVHYFYRLRSAAEGPNFFRNSLAFIVKLPFELYNLCLFIKKEKVAAINVHYCGLYALNISILKIPRLFRGTFILSFHGKDFLAARQAHGIEKVLWKILLRSADRIVTCSESLKTSVARIDRHCARRIVAIHNGIDISRLERNADRVFSSDEPLYGTAFILNVASFDPVKGQDSLILAFSKIAQDFPELRLVMIGRRGETKDKLEELVRSLGLSPRIWFYDGLPHDSLGVFYKHATIFALPSRFESFGIVILEAGVFGIPVVATDVGGIGEILVHNQTGRLYQSDDIDSLARELTYLLERPEERERLGKNLRRHVVQNFSWDRTYRSYLSCVAG